MYQCRKNTIFNIFLLAGPGRQAIALDIGYYNKIKIKKLKQQLTIPDDYLYINTALSINKKKISSKIIISTFTINIHYTALSSTTIFILYIPTNMIMIPMYMYMLLQNEEACYLEQQDWCSIYIIESYNQTTVYIII